MEADFQEYYNLDINLEIKRDFARAGRLFTQLPASSRIMTTYSPVKDWSWDKETQSRILSKLDNILVLLGNAFRDKRKSKKFEPEPQWQPDYVKDAKEEARTKELERRKLSDDEMKASIEFWKAKNHEATFIEDTI